MTNPSLDIFTEMHTDVKYIRTNLENHIKECEGVRNDYIKPLWEKHQQEIGASKAGKIGAVLLDRSATILLAVAGAWAAFRGLKP